MWLCLSTCVAMAQQPTLEQLRQVGLPLVEVTTVDGEEPTCDYLSPPDGLSGLTIDNATKVPGRLRIWRHGEYVYDSGEYVKDTTGMRIKIRGNTSAYEKKKSFKVKLEKKADLLFRDDDAYRDREWLLMKDDQNVKGGELLHLMIGLRAASLCGMPWQPQAEFVNLMMNGDYRGVYMLCESIKCDKMRVDIDHDKGFIIERDPYWWKEDFFFATDRHRMHYTFKHPDDDDVTIEEVDRVKAMMDEVENAIWNGGIDALVDIDIMATWLMAHDILGTWDSLGSNIYLTRHDDAPDSKILMGPLWDFGSIMRMEGNWASVHTGEAFYFHYLLHLAASVNRPFIEAYQSAWERRGKYVPDEMVDYLTTFLASDEAEALQTSNQWDVERWNRPYLSVEEMAEKAIVWFGQRKEWLSSAVETMAIDDIRYEAPSASKKHVVRYYDLGGATASQEGKGLRIRIEQTEDGRLAVKTYNLR